MQSELPTHRGGHEQDVPTGAKKEPGGDIGLAFKKAGKSVKSAASLFFTSPSLMIPTFKAILIADTYLFFSMKSGPEFIGAAALGLVALGIGTTILESTGDTYAERKAKKDGSELTTSKKPWKVPSMIKNAFEWGQDKVESFNQLTLKHPAKSFIAGVVGSFGTLAGTGAALVMAQPLESPALSTAVLVGGIITLFNVTKVADAALNGREPFPIVRKTRLDSASFDGGTEKNSHTLTDPITKRFP